MKNFLKLCCFIIVMIVSTVFIIDLYFSHKTYYLNVEFFFVSGEVAEISEIKVSKGITLNGFLVDDLTDMTIIDDKMSIEKIINYLNNVPLSLSSEKELPAISDGKNGTILFYAEDGKELGWITIKGKYVQRDIDLKVFEVCNDEMYIISGLETLFK